ncbi:HAD-IA family hydrolase [Candidatus Bathyarchaeota archaeon]|nr:HAD-IA family hydrolase [Candidatus Bathyarchaeota archaeon]
MSNLKTYCVEGFEEIEAVTFDHYNTLQHSTLENREDIIHPIMRSLKTHIDLDEDKFHVKYTEQDEKYRKNQRETFVETTLDEMILKALLDSCHHDSELAKIVKTSVDHGLRTRGLTWYPEAEETLLRLKELGYKLGLICNTHWRWLPERRREVQPFFDVLTLSYEHGYMKPHPSIFHATTRELGVKPAKCLHVGDNLFADIHGARQAGMRAAYIRRNEGDAEADVIIQRLSELIRYLDK